MAVTVVLVVTFLTGVLVGRGVRVERAVEQQAAAVEDVPAPPPHTPVVPPQGGDPTVAVPTAGAEESDSNAKTLPPAGEEPPVAVVRQPDRPTVAVGEPDPSKASKA